MFRRTLFLLAGATALVACADQPTSVTPPIAASEALSVRSEAQRAKWRFKLDGDYSLHSPGVGADGTVYVAMSNGKLYAVAPDGTQRWVVQAGLGGGAFGPVSVGSDGTIYVAGMVASPSGTGNTGAILAYTPAGTRNWVFSATNQLIKAGPSIGPDGNIYAVTRLSGIGLFSLTPAGQLRFSTGVFSERGLLGEEIAFGAKQMYFAFDMYATGFPASLFSYDFNGGKLFQVFNIAQHTQPAVGPNGNVVIESSAGGLAAYAPSGALLWSFYHFPGGTVHPDVGPDNIAYTVSALSTLSAIDPSGTERWRYVDSVIMFEPKVRPSNDLVFMGGRITYGQPGLFQAVSTNGTPLWRVNLPDEPGFSPYGQLVPMTRPIFSPDGNTAYAVTDVAGDGASTKPYSFLYAVDLSPTSNQNPVANFTYSCVARVPPPGFRCSLDGSSSSDPDGSVTAWSWTSPGKPTKSGVTTSYIFPAAGNYSVTLTVTDNSGGTGSQTQTIVVGGRPPVNQNPTANFTINCVPRTPNVGSDCTFNGNSSSDPDGSVVGFAWSSPGKPNKSGAIITYPFPRGTNTTVTLVVTDNQGATGTKTSPVVIP